jgi:hypothetical protein
MLPSGKYSSYMMMVVTNFMVLKTVTDHELGYNTYTNTSYSV